MVVFLNLPHELRVTEGRAFVRRGIAGAAEIVYFTSPADLYWPIES